MMSCDFCHRRQMQKINDFSKNFRALGQTRNINENEDTLHSNELFISNNLRIDKIAEDIAAIGTVGRAQIVGS